MKWRLIRPVVPPHVFCLLADGVSYASVRRANPPGLAHSRSFAYPPGSLGSGASGTPLFTQEAISEAVAVARRLSEGRLTRASVVFPDEWARILPIDFESVPDSEEAARQMVGWKVKKLLPGITSEMAVTFREMPSTGSPRRLLVAAAPAESLRSIENAFESAGVRVGALAPSSLVLFEGLSSRLAGLAVGDYALVHRAAGSSVFVVARDGEPLFFRQRPTEADPEEHAQEVRLSLAYYAEKLNGPGLSAVYLLDELRNGEFVAPAAFPIAPTALSGRLFGTDAAFDERAAAHPELWTAFAAVYGRR